MLQKIAYISYSVRDLERAVRFYGGTLGLKLLFVHGGWAEFEIAGQRLALRQAATADAPAGGAVVNFSVASIAAAIDALQSRGVCFTGAPQAFSYGKIAYFYDSEGNVLGLYEPPSKSAAAP